MPEIVVMGGQAKCSFGTLPAVISLTPNMVNGVNQSIATIQDFSPMVMSTFGMCSGATNPAVIAQNGAPATCVPLIVAPWAPGAATVTVKGVPALTKDSKCVCTWLGQIEISDAGQTTVKTG